MYIGERNVYKKNYTHSIQWYVKNISFYIIPELLDLSPGYNIKKLKYIL